MTVLRATPDYQGETLIRRPSDVASIEVSADTSDPWTVTMRSLTPGDVVSVAGVITREG